MSISNILDKRTKELNELSNKYICDKLTLAKLSVMKIRHNLPGEHSLRNF